MDRRGKENKNGVAGMRSDRERKKRVRINESIKKEERYFKELLGRVG